MKQLWGELPDQAELEARLSALEQRTGAIAAELVGLHASMLDLSVRLLAMQTQGVPSARLPAE